MSLDECVNLAAARCQRETEGEESKGIEGYRVRGCYDCNGMKLSCNAYQSLRELLPYTNTNRTLGKRERR